MVRLTRTPTKKGTKMFIFHKDYRVDFAIMITLIFLGVALLVFILFKIFPEHFKLLPQQPTESSSVHSTLLTSSQSYDPNKKWREAARPVFQSRGTIDITDHATPEDLKHYLNPCYSVVWQEHGKMDNCEATGIWIKQPR